MSYASFYMTDYGAVRVSDTEAALLMSGDWIEQRPGTADHLSRIMPRYRALKGACEAVARHNVQRAEPAYFWLGAEGEAASKNFQDFK